MVERVKIRATASLGLTACLLGAAAGAQDLGPGPFQRIASFPVFLNTSVDVETVAEIVAATPDGMTLIYTDSETENIGFVDIADPYDPQPDGVVAVGGEPTSVAVRGAYALACINTSEDFVDTSGSLEIIDIASRTIVRSLPLGGQPDAIAVSPNGRYAAIAIENERDEDLGAGEPPQLPAGFLVIVDLVGPVGNWSTRTVDLVGVCDLFPEDPEPEFVDINRANFAVVTCQENNHIIVVHLPSGGIFADFPAGGADLENIDTEENDLIEQTTTRFNVPREPDAVAWTSNITFGTADEGDLFGGSRGFTTWSFFGNTLYQAASTMENEVTRLGHYPEDRSENKGNEPEGVEFGRYAGAQYLFVGSERSSVVFVYELLGNPFFASANPTLRQVLPTGVAPEGLLAIPRRDLFVVACEDDARDDKIRSSIMIYARTEQPNYPTLVSAERPSTGLPIPWGALSGLAHGEGDTVYGIYDSFYRESRVFTVDVSTEPAVLTDELALVDSGNVLIDALNDLKAQLPGTDDYDPAGLINANGTVNLDPEGVTVQDNGNFWIASEGTGNLVAGVSDPEDRPFERPNLLVCAAPDGTILEAVTPPLSLTLNQFRFGFEGVAATPDALFVAFQRAWKDAGDPSDRARIGRYDLASGIWTFAHYPLDSPTSPNGGWVGLSELTHLGDGEFAVLERDNQGGPDAAIKRVYTFSLDGVTFQEDALVGGFDLLGKTLVVDLLAEGAYDSTGGLIPEKLEGLAVLPNGDTLIVNDNDGVDDNSGETQLLRLEGLFD